MSVASLNGLSFRLNPTAIEWGFSIDTSVDDTIGGRVVQVIGATLTDVTLSGEYGERKGYATDAHHRKQELHGRGLLSWELAEQFLLRVRDMMEEQSADSRDMGKMNPPLDFRFPEYGWHFGVYVKGIDDGQSALAIRHTTGAFAYKYRISLFIVEERSAALVLPSKGSTLLEKKKAAAINGYIGRISSGVGWKVSRFNEPTAIINATTGLASRSLDTSEGTGKAVADATANKQDRATA